MIERSTGIDLVAVGLVLAAIVVNCRDLHSEWAKDRRWTVAQVTRRRAVLLITGLIVQWALTALAVVVELSKSPPPWDVLLAIPTMFVLQICLLRRSELFQPRGDSTPVSGPRGELGV